MLAISATSQNWKEKHWVTPDVANWCRDLYAKFKPMVLIASWWPNYKLSGGINLDYYLEHLHRAQYVTPDSKIYCEKSENVPV